MEKLRLAGTRARAIAEAAKCGSKLNEMHNALRNAFCELGEACYAGNDEKVLVKKAEINALQGQMNALGEEIDALRNERRCIRCGKVQSSENRYCAHCGAVLKTGEACILWPETAEIQPEKNDGEKEE